MQSTLDELEICLLTSEWRNPSCSNQQVSSIAERVVSGDFKDVLDCDLAKELLTLQSDEDGESTLANSFRFQLSTLSDQRDIELTRLTVAVACLHAFLQENWTGPPTGIQPSALLSTSISDDDLNRRCINELTLGGEPAYHLAKLAVLLRISQLLLDLPYKHLLSAGWWKRRIATVHQLVLDEPVPFEIPKLDTVYDVAFRLSTDLAGRIILEEGLLHHHLGQDKEAFDCFTRAAAIMGLEYEVTGALGKRTKFQESELSQLVLLARSRDRDGKGADKSTPPTNDNSHPNQKPSVPENLPLNDDTLLEEMQFSKRGDNTSNRLSDLDPSNQPALYPLDQCVFLGMCLNVRNTSPSHGLTSEQMMPYISRVISHPKNWSVHTMALLLRSRLEANRTRTVERSVLQLQQLVEQMPSNDSLVRERLLYFHTLPLPSKWDLEKELALRFMSLGVVKSALEIFERLEMWEEVVKCWGSMERPDRGVAIVQDLLAGRKQESEAATYRSKSLTSDEKLQKLDSAREAKLWCLLGDLEPENAEEHYSKAWKISGETSGRAIRSLGGYYFARNNFSEAIRCLALTVANNPLLTRSWFILGCAYVREEKWREARDAFARCVSIDDEDAESWNNLASVYLRLSPDENKEMGQAVDGEEATASHRTAFDNKLLAFKALQRGLKFGNENWRMWVNYMIVAMDVGELSEASRALGRIVEQRADQDKEKCVDVEVLERLVDACGRVDGEDEDGMSAESRYTKPNEGRALARRVFDLIERQILPRISSSPRIFRAYGRLLVSEARYPEALEAQLNAYRLTAAGGGKGSDISTTEEWQEAVVDVEEIVDVLRNLGPNAKGEPISHGPVSKSPRGPGTLDEPDDFETGVSGGDTVNAANAASPRNWILQARSILRAFLGRTRRDFEDEPEYKKLQELMQEVRGEATTGGE